MSIGVRTFHIGKARRKLFDKRRKKVANAASYLLSALFALACPLGQAMTEARVISKLKRLVQVFGGESNDNIATGVESLLASA